FRLGGSASARLLRVYDKEKESAGVIPSTRLELQSRDEFATALVRRMLVAHELGQTVAQVFLGHLVEFVDLREAKGSRSGSHKWPRLPWWQALVGDLKGISTPGRADSEVWAWVSAIRRQFAGALVVFLRAAGVDAQAYRAARRDPAAAMKVVSGLRTLLGPVLAELSAEHELRLDQLMRDNRRELRRLANWR
ncbi:MAG: replication initiation factor domain-containing protein, partial [Hyphomicrobium sp.]